MPTGHLMPAWTAPLVAVAGTGIARTGIRGVAGGGDHMFRKHKVTSA
jgi:hypothetical protein